MEIDERKRSLIEEDGQKNISDDLKIDDEYSFINYLDEEYGQKHISDDLKIDDEYSFMNYLDEEELKEYYAHKYAWQDELTDEDFNENNDPVYIKSFEEGHNSIIIDDNSLLHQDNAYYQKIIPRWDWIEITGKLSTENYAVLIEYLNGSSDFEVFSWADTMTYNYEPGKKKHYFNKYSNFRVKIYETNQNIKRVRLSIASTILNDEKMKERFKKIRLYLDRKTIQLERIDLSFLFLLDLSNIIFNLKHSKTKATVRNTNTSRIETTTLGTYNSAIRASLYNKKVQMKDKKKMELHVKHLYNLEFTFNIGKVKNKDVNIWRYAVHEKLSLMQNILTYYRPKQTTDFALMYLYIDNKALFKERYPDDKDNRRMSRHYNGLKNDLEEDGIDMDLSPYIIEALEHSKGRLADIIYDLTGLKI